jgi:spoIIIJ-associated protein
MVAGARLINNEVSMSDANTPDPIEVAGPTKEEAIEDGLAQLGLTINDVIIEILDEGSAGMLGFGSREALVRLVPLRPPRPQRAAVSESDDDVGVARDVLEELLNRMSINATIHAHQADAQDPDEPPPWVLDIQGGDLGVLIGRRGETLNALQYITRLITSRETQQRSDVIVDVQGYKLRREDTLRKLAHRMADEARRRGRTMTLEPMSPYERRIIHISLRSDETVTTESVGEGNRRRVTIIPVREQRR